MAQACTFGSVKLILVTFTSIISCLGAALLAISIYLYLNEDGVALAEEDVAGFDSGIVIFICMGAGGAMILISIIGLIGAIFKSSGTLYFFMFILFLTLILEIGGGIVGFVWRDQVQDDLPMEMKKALQKYDNDNDIKKAWDKIHDKYECCGRMGPADWTTLGQNIPGTCKNYKVATGFGMESHFLLPFLVSTQEYNTPYTLSLPFMGCYYDVEKNLKRTLEMGAAALMAFGLFQMLVMCFTGLMLIKLHRGEGRNFVPNHK